MGRRRNRQQEERDAALFALGREAGRREGRREGFLKVLARIARRLFRQDANDAARMLREHGPERTLRALGRLAEDVWAGRWREGMADALEEIMDAAPLRTKDGPVSLSFDLAIPTLNNYFEGYLVRLSGEVTDTTREKVTKAIREALDEGLSVPETAKRVEALGDEFGRSRANLVAADQLLKASRGAAYIKAAQSPVVVGRRWRTARDARVREAHRIMEGEYAAMGERYSNGQLVAGESDVQCRCTEEFVVDAAILAGESA
jgi:uncharacterized protein with gpF-like domain